MMPPAQGTPLAVQKVIVRDLFDATALSRCSWTPFREGIEICRLYQDETRAEGQGASAALLRYRAGAQAPLHEHPDFEQVLVLQGSQRDDHGTYEPGTLVVNGPGTRHFVVSEHGCIVLAIWSRPVVFVEGGEQVVQEVAR